MTAKLKAKEQHIPGYPDRETKPERWGCDGGRRRFLKQIGLMSGVAGLGGLPRVGHGQGIPVDFERLATHPPNSQEPARESEEELSVANNAMSDEAADYDREDLFEEQAQAEPPGSAEIVTENRALWVEPGYLVLLRWRRASEDEAVVSALEGLGATVSAFLTENVTSVDHLHNIEALHLIERNLLAVVTPMIASATIEVLHLDHDCASVCSLLNPGDTYPDRWQLDGEMVAPGWE